MYLYYAFFFFSIHLLENLSVKYEAIFKLPTAAINTNNLSVIFFRINYFFFSSSSFGLRKNIGLANIFLILIFLFFNYYYFLLLTYSFFFHINYLKLL